MSRRLGVAFLGLALGWGGSLRAEDTATAPAPVKVGFDEAVRRAVEHHPTARQAAQAILRAEALLDEAKAIFRPSVYGGIATTILNAAQGFQGEITQPKTQSAFTATASYPILAPTRWAEKSQAADQVRVARISAEETRRQVALSAAQAYLAVIAAEHQREIASRSLETARALEEYAKARLEAGKGSRLNHVRSIQEEAVAEGRLEAAELAVRQAQEALGVTVFADGPLDADGEPEIRPAVPPSSEMWLEQRPDVRLFTAQVSAADKVVRDSWTSWLPTGVASFVPEYLTPPGAFERAKTWTALFQFQIPLYDGSLGAVKRTRVADLESAKVRLEATKTQARADLRLAQESVERSEHITVTSLRAAANALEALGMAEVAYRAGATSNIEVVQAQQTAREAEIESAQAADRLLEARLDLLVALGQFPQ